MQDTTVDDKIKDNFSRIAASLDELSKHLDVLEDHQHQKETKSQKNKQ